MGLLKKFLESRYPQVDGSADTPSVRNNSDTPSIRIKPLKFEVRPVETWNALGQSVAGKEFAADSVLGKFSIGQEDDGAYVLKRNSAVLARDSSPSALLSFAQSNYHSAIRGCLETSGVIVTPYIVEKE
jgi:hypothetical protein